MSGEEPQVRRTFYSTSHKSFREACFAKSILQFVLKLIAYRIIPNRSTGCLDKSQGRGYIRFREPGATVTNMIYKRNRPSKLGGASIRGGAFIGDNTVYIQMLPDGGNIT